MEWIKLISKQQDFIECLVIAHWVPALETLREWYKMQELLLRNSKLSNGQGR